MDKPNGKLTPIERQMLIDDFIERIPFQIKLYAESSKLFKARFVMHWLQLVSQRIRLWRL
ncbi:hypothetical protein NDK47_13035 [Brevibacillus ruminantium]|uniref:Uncharacterized protein n=1 Tax=Brevibacillus ruminantium TaxID=2950604 RepID=A0ABY4WLW1_9BACL|nr:hypothetical protein [Brevibacillus ruminantium]USG68145.1 hypothetical protein NDK47_13035 [Brevibacillus ruminantium]